MYSLNPWFVLLISHYRWANSCMQAIVATELNVLLGEGLEWELGNAVPFVEVCPEVILYKHTTKSYVYSHS